MSWWRFVVCNLRYYWRIHAAVLLGAAAATAVLTGALVVGDSMRYSLRMLTLSRLGAIDELLLSDRFFDPDLAGQLADSNSVNRAGITRIASAILVPSGTLERPRQSGDPDTVPPRLAGNVLVLGIEPSFWDFGQVAPEPHPERGEVVLNAALAERIGATVGEQVTLRLGRVDTIPVESPLGERLDRIQSLPRLTVVDILPDDGLGRFSLQASQSSPLNAYLPLETLQDLLDQDGMVNALLVADERPNEPTSIEQSAALADALKPTFEAYGLASRRSRVEWRESEESDPEVLMNDLSLFSDRMILEPAAVEGAEAAFAERGGYPVLTYLVNEMQVADGAESDEQVEPAEPGRIVPYSMVASLPNEVLQDWEDIRGEPLPQLRDREIVLTDWVARELGAEVGDRLRLVYFEPESTHGEPNEMDAAFMVRAIVPLEPSLTRAAAASIEAANALTDTLLPVPSEPFWRQPLYAGRPSPANDPFWTPEVEGVTDEGSVRDWEVPFDPDYTHLTDIDEAFWDEHGTTPKAFVSLEAGRELWGSRFGDTTSYRLPAAGGVEQAEFERRIVASLSPRDMGFAFVPIKRRQLEASSGTTPFDGLFLGLSFFIIAAALLLVLLLFRLGIEQRAAELGLLLALGVRRRAAAFLLIREGLVVSGIAGIAGLALGLGYAWIMIYGLKSWWREAIVTPFLEFHANAVTLLAGYGAGVVISVLVIAWSTWQLRRVAPRRLLAGTCSRGGVFAPRSVRVARVAGVLLLIAALGLAALAATLTAEAQAGAFFGAGASMLAAWLCLAWAAFRSWGGSARDAGEKLDLARLATGNAARNAIRSTLTIGLLATASFLIVALSSFRQSPTERGTGGIDYVAETSEPVIRDLDAEYASGEGSPSASGARILALRLRPGDDASCTNLYQSTQPRVLGVPTDMVEYFDDPSGEARPNFGWAGAAEGFEGNPWAALAHDTPSDGPVPVILDKNTAAYSLHTGTRIGEEFEFEYDGRPIRFQVVGLLSNSILQGQLFIGEADFRRLFDNTSGYRVFLIETAGDDELVDRLAGDLQYEGFTAVPATEILAELLAVQNTYLSTFQILGALGLLLGTFGLAAVQLRSVLERRGELALLRATGYGRQRLARLVLYEHLVLLAAGLGIGIAAALLAVLPHVVVGGASVPWAQLAVLLALVAAAGAVSSLAAVRATLRAPLLGALRGD